VGKICEWEAEDIGKEVVDDETGTTARFISRCEYPSFCIEFPNGKRLDAAIGSPVSKGWRVKE
jgi:hypothetical protein